MTGHHEQLQILAAQRREMARGGFWGLGTMGIALLYALLTAGSHRATLLIAATVGATMSVGLGLLGSCWPPLVRARRPVMFLYTTAHVVLTAVLASADGGADSPMAPGSSERSASPLRDAPAPDAGVRPLQRRRRRERSRRVLVVSARPG